MFIVYRPGTDCIFDIDTAGIATSSWEPVYPSREGNCMYIHHVKETVWISITSRNQYIHHVKETWYPSRQGNCVYVSITSRKPYIHHVKETVCISISSTKLYCCISITPRKLYIHHGYCPYIFIWTLHIYQGTARTPSQTEYFAMRILCIIVLSWKTETTFYYCLKIKNSLKLSN